MELTPEAIAAFVAARPGSSKLNRGVLGRYAAYLAEHPEASPDAWVATLSISSETATTYRGIIRAFLRATTPEITSPAARAERTRRIRQDMKASRDATTSTPDPVPTVPAVPQADVVAALDAMRAKLDEVAVALSLRPLSDPSSGDGRDVPAEVLRFQLAALARGLGVLGAAEHADVAPAALTRMLRGGAVPHVRNKLAVDEAYVRLRWLERDLAEDEELDTMIDLMRAPMRAQLDELAEGRGADGGH